MKLLFIPSSEHRFRLFLTAILFGLSVVNSNSKADVVPLTPEQNLAVLAKFMPNRFSGDTNFEICARSWRQNRSPDFCDEYYREVREFAEENAGGLTEDLFFHMIDFYIGLHDQADPKCKSIGERTTKYCGNMYSELYKNLLKEFKGHYGY
ncbi:hypothetical protein [Roseibium sp. M-1]